MNDIKRELQEMREIAEKREATRCIETAYQAGYLKAVLDLERYIKQREYLTRIGRYEENME